MFTYCADGKEKTEVLPLMTVAQEGFENDMMITGLQFSQEHINNLSKKMLCI